MTKYAYHSGPARVIALPLKTCIYVVKVKMSNYRPGEALSSPGVSGFQNF